MRSITDKYPVSSPKAEPKSQRASPDEPKPARPKPEPKTRVVANPQSKPCEIDFPELERKQQKKREGLRAVPGTKQVCLW
jgi:hypothetical protein